MPLEVPDQKQQTKAPTLEENLEALDAIKAFYGDNVTGLEEARAKLYEKHSQKA